MVPMTLISFIGTRPPAERGVAMTFMWTTVSTASSRSSRAVAGLRMSARTKRAPPSEEWGGTTSVPITAGRVGWAASAVATLPPRYLETPVTSTTRRLTAAPDPPRAPYFLLRRW